MYYPCSENKGADQLRGYREADLRLCFRLGKNPVFSRCGSYDMINMVLNNTVIFCFNSFLYIDPLKSNEDAEYRMVSAKFAEKFLTFTVGFGALRKHFQDAKKGNNH